MAKNSLQLFTSLHREYYRMVLQLCKGFLKGDSDTARDLAQDVFVNTWNALDKFKGASTYKTWIYRITVNTCLKFLRDHKNKQNASIDNAILYEENSGETDSENASSELYYAIGKLNELDRLVIIMVLEGLPYEEIAGVMGLTNENLRVRIHRLKKELKKILENARSI
jgi:RNA polymerase sigma-70 factor (ECF subfamily)